jgi:hypothetical protein
MPQRRRRTPGAKSRRRGVPPPRKGTARRGRSTRSGRTAQQLRVSRARARTRGRLPTPPDSGIGRAGRAGHTSPWARRHSCSFCSTHCCCHWVGKSSYRSGSTAPPASAACAGEARRPRCQAAWRSASASHSRRNSSGFAVYNTRWLRRPACLRACRDRPRRDLLRLRRLAAPATPTAQRRALLGDGHGRRSVRPSV